MQQTTEESVDGRNGKIEKSKKFAELPKKGGKYFAKKKMLQQRFSYRLITLTNVFRRIGERIRDKNSKTLRNLIKSFLRNRRIVGSLTFKLVYRRIGEIAISKLNGSVGVKIGFTL